MLTKRDIENDNQDSLNGKRVNQVIIKYFKNLI